MDTTLALLLTVLACTFIGMIAAIIAATNRAPTGTQTKPKPPVVRQIKEANAIMPVQWHDLPVALPQDSVRYKGVVVVTRHIDVRIPLVR